MVAHLVFIMATLGLWPKKLLDGKGPFGGNVFKYPARFFVGVFVADRGISLHLGRKSYYSKGLYRPPPRRVLGRPIKKFKSRLFARRRCEKIAKYGRYRVFALQYGRYCYVTRLRRKFVMYGRSKSSRLGAIKVYQRTNGRPSSPRIM